MSAMAIAVSDLQHRMPSSVILWSEMLNWDQLRRLPVKKFVLAVYFLHLVLKNEVGGDAVNAAKSPQNRRAREIEVLERHKGQSHCRGSVLGISKEGRRPV